MSSDRTVAPIRRRLHAAGAAMLALALLAGCAEAEPPPVETPSPPPSSTAVSASPVATASDTPRSTADATPTPTPTAVMTWEMETYHVVAGSHPHDVAPAADGRVWYTGQDNGALGWLNPDTEEVGEIDLGPGSRPHGVIIDRNGDPWITNGGIANEIVRADAETEEITRYPLAGDPVNLNTATFDGDDVLWFTGQEGVIGSVDPDTREVRTFAAPRGKGPYGIATIRMARCGSARSPAAIWARSTGRPARSG